MHNTNKDKKELATNRLLEILRGEPVAGSDQNAEGAGRNAEAQLGLSEKEQSALTGRSRDFNAKKFAAQRHKKQFFAGSFIDSIFMKFGFSGLIIVIAALLVFSIAGWYFIFYVPENNKIAELKPDNQFDQGEIAASYITPGTIDSLRKNIAELQEQAQKSRALSMPKDSMLYALRILEDKIKKQNQEIARVVQSSVIISDTTDVFERLANMIFRGSVEYGKIKIALINDRLYEIGDIVDGLKIIEIHSDRVVLKDRDGTGYTLR